MNFLGGREANFLSDEMTIGLERWKYATKIWQNNATKGDVSFYPSQQIPQKKLDHELNGRINLRSRKQSDKTGTETAWVQKR